METDLTSAIKNDPIFQLPILEYEGDYLDALNNKFNELRATLIRIETPVSSKRSTKTLGIDEVRQAVDEFCQAITASTELSYRGFPDRALHVLKTVLDKWTTHFKMIRMMGSDTNMYRLREKDTQYAIDYNQLFHISFEERHKVKMQRFSISGCPMLYLSNSVYTAWEEMRRPRMHNFWASRFNITTQLNVLDLTYKRKVSIFNDPYSILSYVIFHPIRIACYFKTKIEYSNFNPEYIIPQLLLQWVQENEDQHGIQYNSLHCDNSENNNLNFVFASKEIKTKGYCSFLKESLQMTQPINYDLLVSSDIQAAGNHIPKKIINDEIKEININPSQKGYYSLSSLGFLEMKLNKTKSTPCKDTL